MDKEPDELVNARAWLRKWEESTGDPGRLSHLKQGIGLLFDIIMGDYDKTYKDRALNLAVAYRAKIVSDVKAILLNTDSYELGFLQYWQDAMEVFAEATLDDDQPFKTCKEQLWSKWAQQFLGSLKPWELQILKSEFQKKATLKS